MNVYNKVMHEKTVIKVQNCSKSKIDANALKGQPKSAKGKAIQRKASFSKKMVETQNFASTQPPSLSVKKVKVSKSHKSLNFK